MSRRPSFAPALRAWWRDAGRAEHAVVVLGLAGLTLVLSSMLPGPGPDDAWMRDFLMTVGASALLFMPFYVITRSLDRHLDRVATETARQVEGVRADTAQQVAAVRGEAAEASAALSGQVEALRADVDRRLAEAAARVAARLHAEAEADRAAFNSLRSQAPTRDAFWDALERATRLGLVSTRHAPRVRVSDAGRLYVGVELDLRDIADEPLQFRIETESGRVEDWIPWPSDADDEDVMVEVGRAIYRHTSETFDLAAFLSGLADLLDAALSDPERRPAIQLCPPQWMVCDWGVVAYDDEGGTYGVNLRTLQQSPSISPDVADKPWVDVESWDAARGAALALFGASDPWATTENPPF